MNFFVQWLHHHGRQIVKQPLSREVPGTQDAYIHSEGLSKLGWRVLRRKMYLFFSGQTSLLRERADPGWKKGLWIYLRTAQIGDSLMDLAARDFFQKCGCTIDLLTHEKLSDLYQGDDWFGHVTSNISSLSVEDYDFIIVQSIHYRALNLKVKFFKSKPWLCIQGFYDVPDFARSLWGAQRLLDFWNYSNFFSAEQIGVQKLSKKYLVPFSQKRNDIVLVLGGMDPVRTYPHWDRVLKSVTVTENISIVLIGTGQAAKEAAQSILLSDLHFKIIDKTNQLSLSQCIDELANTKLLLVADGGAMHLGVAVQVPKMVSLFIKEIPPILRIPAAYFGLSIVSSTGFIRDIPSNDIAHNVQLALVEN